MNRFYVQDYGTCWDKYTVLEAVSKLSKCGDSVPGPLGGSASSVGLTY